VCTGGSQRPRGLLPALVVDLDAAQIEREIACPQPVERGSRGALVQMSQAQILRDRRGSAHATFVIRFGTGAPTARIINHETVSTAMLDDRSMIAPWRASSMATSIGLGWVTFDGGVRPAELPATSSIRQHPRAR
jgi:hypothetical protein